MAQTESNLSHAHCWVIAKVQQGCRHTWTYTQQLDIDRLPVRVWNNGHQFDTACSGGTVSLYGTIRYCKFPMRPMCGPYLATCRLGLNSGCESFWSWLGIPDIRREVRKTWNLEVGKIRKSMVADFPEELSLPVFIDYSLTILPINCTCTTAMPRHWSLLKVNMCIYIYDIILYGHTVSTVYNNCIAFFQTSRICHTLLVNMFYPKLAVKKTQFLCITHGFCSSFFSSMFVCN